MSQDHAQDAPSPAPVLAPERPADLPEPFWDAEAGAVRTEALLQSYLELERKLETLASPGEVPALDAGQVAPAAAAERPAGPEDYAIQARHSLIEPDPEINARLFEAGFSKAQAQLVYDLAAERLLPMAQEMLGEVEATRQLDKLERHFGGAETWRHTAGQIKRWAKAHLAGEVYETLSTSFEGVLALHQMMRASEPELLSTGEPPPRELSAETLAEMVRDPRYWRERDPEFVARVAAGFKQLYAG